MVYGQTFLESEFGLKVDIVRPHGKLTGRTRLLGGASFRHLSSIRRRLESEPQARIVWFVPTAAQVPLAAWAMRGLPNPAGAFIEGAPFMLHGDWLSAARRTPWFVLARAVLNNEALGRIPRPSRDIPLAAASQWQTDRLRKLFPTSNVFHIVNGSPNMPLERKWAPMSLMNVRLIGHSRHYKGIDFAARVCERLRGYLPGVTLDWANPEKGPVAGWTEAGQATWKTLHGQVNSYEFLSAGSILVAPLRVSWGTNAYPNALIEAMACGVPLLTSDLPIHRELLGETAELAIVPGFDLDAWADRLGALLTCRRKLEELSGALLARAQTLWDTARLTSDWAAFLAAMA